MQISDEMVDKAAAVYESSEGSMRAALESALGASTEFAKLKDEHEAMGRARCDAAACIEDLAGALKEVISVSDRATDIYDRARATLERWGLK